MAFAPFPHHYRSTAVAQPEGPNDVRSPGLSTLVMDAPAEFGGPGTLWSPEALMAAAVADCFVLTFKSVARASSLPWQTLTCEAVGTLERVDRATQFTAFDIRARLEVPPGTDAARAHRLLEKADQVCLVTNSLRCEVRFEGVVSDAPVVAAS